MSETHVGFVSTRSMIARSARAAAVGASLAFALVAHASPGMEETRQRLRQHCLIFAADPKNPWALAHGVTALGRSFVAADGRRAVDVMVGDFLKKENPDAGSPFGFDRFGAEGVPVEPHTNLITKTLVLANVPPQTKFRTSFGKVGLRELVESAKWGFRHTPSSEDYWRDAAWTLDLLGSVLGPGKKALFQNGAGQTVDFDGVMDDALEYLEKVQADLANGMERGLGQVDKRKQGIYAHTCGGLHFVQAVDQWARFPDVRKKWGARLDKQVEVLFYRLGSETRQYEAALVQAPQFKLQLLTQELKFYGHFLETVGRLKKELRYPFTESQLRDVARARAYLDHAVRQLDEVHAFETMDALRRNQPQIYLDLIGDSCHAAHGWDLWPK